jgi:DNA-binding ferritin-like protein
MTEPYHKQISESVVVEAETPIAAVQGDLPEKLRSKNGKELLREVLAALRAQYFVYHTFHWATQGRKFYKNHMLFERLYDSVEDQIDALAEKLVGYYGSEAVNQTDAVGRMQKWVNSWKGDDPIQVAYDFEKQFQALLRRTYDTMSQKKELSLGLDDFLMATASEHEVNLYLLGQILEEEK